MRAAAAAAAAAKAAGAAPALKLTVWPETLVDFFTKRLSSMFTIRAYPLDPALLANPERLRALPQTLPTSALPIEGDPLSGLIKVHDIPAQRGFGEIPSGVEEEGELQTSPGGTRLSEQLRSYYAKHLDPAKGPDPTDLEALQAMEAAEDAFDLKLMESFNECFIEVAGLGYPGVSDPRPRVSGRTGQVSIPSSQARLPSSGRGTSRSIPSTLPALIASDPKRDVLTGLKAQTGEVGPQQQQVGRP